MVKFIVGESGLVTKYFFAILCVFAGFRQFDDQLCDLSKRAGIFEDATSGFNGLASLLSSLWQDK
jgi:hypothetical protein